MVGGPDLHRLSAETLFTVRVWRCAPHSLSTPPPKVTYRICTDLTRATDLPLSRLLKFPKHWVPTP